MVNEVTVEDEGSVHDYARHCYTLLQVHLPCSKPPYGAHGIET